MGPFCPKPAQKSDCGLVGVLAESLPLENWQIGLDMIKTGSVPFVAFGIFLIVRRGSRAILEARTKS